MFRIMSIVSLFILIAFGSGCATVATGKYQDVPITSDPPGVKVRSDTGVSITTPGRMMLSRNKLHTLVAEYPGCDPQQVQLKNKVQGWFWGNIILGGIIGGVIDIVSGSCDELVPKNVHFNFTNSGQEIAKRKNSYLESHPDTKDEVKFAILNGIAVKDMTEEELSASLGEPDQIERTKKHTKYVYANQKPESYYFDNGKLTQTK
jgi:hypothetical protein